MALFLNRQNPTTFRTVFRTEQSPRGRLNSCDQIFDEETTCVSPIGSARKISEYSRTTLDPTFLESIHPAHASLHDVMRTIWNHLKSLDALNRARRLNGWNVWNWPQRLERFERLERGPFYGGHVMRAPEFLMQLVNMLSPELLSQRFRCPSACRQ
jgi:hypothetical protein